MAEASANEVKALMKTLPGRPPWGAQADAAMGLVALARGDREGAVGHALSAVQALMESLHEDTHFEIVVSIAKVVMAAGSGEQQGMVQFFLRTFLAVAAQRTLDADVRAKWFRAPMGRQLVDLAGSLDGFALRPAEGDGDGQVDGGSVELLRLLTEGLTNQEIAERLGEDETTVARRLGELFARLGTASRSEATAYAFRERVV